ncbi:MAG: tRNA pseudouridine(38-40) synthase TruA, partial [Candidatus Omnitrophota bacterium]
MKTFKLTLEYDGTDFNGWQLQLNAQRTVQGEIEKALSKIFKK